MEQVMNSVLTHQFLSAEQLQLIRQESSNIEKNGQLSAPILDMIYANNWLKIMVPKSCGGLEWSLPQIVRLFETLAHADGSVGWNVNLGAGANLFSGYFSDEVAQTIFSNPKVWCAGSGASTGTAQRVENGYLINGYWKYASGSAHATHFTANCKLLDEDGNLITEDGKAVFRSFIFPKADVTIHNTWNVMGLKATASNDFEIKDLVVSEQAVFTLLKPSEFASAPIFKVPFDTLAFSNMASMVVGMTAHFLELFATEILPKKPLYCDLKMEERKGVSAIYEKYNAQFSALRLAFYHLLETCWNAYENGVQPSTDDLNALRLKAKETASLAREIVASLVPLCGMNIIFEDNEISRVYRDLTVGCQHYLLAPEME